MCNSHVVLSVTHSMHNSTHLLYMFLLCFTVKEPGAKGEAPSLFLLRVKKSNISGESKKKVNTRT